MSHNVWHTRHEQMTSTHQESHPRDTSVVEDWPQVGQTALASLSANEDVIPTGLVQHQTDSSATSNLGYNVQSKEAYSLDGSASYIAAPVPLSSFSARIHPPMAGPSSAPQRPLLISSKSDHIISAPGDVVFGNVNLLNSEHPRSGSISPISPRVKTNADSDAEEITWQFGTIGLSTPTPSPPPIANPPNAHPLMPLQPVDVLSPLSLSPGPSYVQQHYPIPYYPSALSNQYIPPIPPSISRTTPPNPDSTSPTPVDYPLVETANPTGMFRVQDFGYGFGQQMASNSENYHYVAQYPMNQYSPYPPFNSPTGYHTPPEPGREWYPPQNQQFTPTPGNAFRGGRRGGRSRSRGYPMRGAGGTRGQWRGSGYNNYNGPSRDTYIDMPPRQNGYHNNQQNLPSPVQFTPPAALDGSVSPNLINTNPSTPHSPYVTPYQDVVHVHNGSAPGQDYIPLLRQLEYYLSPTNMETDFWLRRQMSVDGWIPISLLSSFNRVQQLLSSMRLHPTTATDDERKQADSNLIRSVLSNSSEVELSEYLPDAALSVRMRDWQRWILPKTTSENGTSPTDHPVSSLTTSVSEQAGVSNEDAEEYGEEEEEDEEDEEEEEEEEEVVFVLGQHASKGPGWRS